MNDAADAVRLQDVFKTYPGGIEAVRGVNLSVVPGEMLAIMGKSGSGKSTLLNLIGTLDLADSGSIELHGAEVRSLTNLPKFRREQVGFVFQLHYLLPHLTLLDNVALPIHGKPGATALAREALERVGLAHRVTHVPGKVSGGERQRAAIARAVVNKPRVLLADEPTGNVDSENEEGILALFDELRRTLGMTVIVVTHEPGVAARADRVAYFKDGRIDRVENRGSVRHES